MKKRTASVIPVVEQRDVEAGPESLEERSKRARALGELEAEDALVGDVAPAADEVPRVALGELVVRDVERAHVARGELGEDAGELLLAHLVRRRQRRRVPVRERRGWLGERRGGEVEGEEDEGAGGGRVAVDELGHRARVDDRVQREETGNASELKKLPVIGGK